MIRARMIARLSLSSAAAHSLSLSLFITLSLSLYTTLSASIVVGQASAYCFGSNVFTFKPSFFYFTTVAGAKGKQIEIVSERESNVPELLPVFK